MLGLDHLTHALTGDQDLWIAGSILGGSVWFAVNGLIGRSIGRRRGHRIAGFWLGALFSVVGWLLTTALPAPRQLDARQRALAHSNLMAMQRSGQRFGPATPAPPPSAARTRPARA